MDKKRKIAAGSILGILVLFLVFLAISKFESRPDPNSYAYKEITDIPGISFIVPSELVETATAVTEISNSSNLSEYNAYSFKNGKDTYLVFNISRFIIVAQAGTHFNLPENGISSLQTNGMDGIWFTPLKDDKLTSENGVCRVDVKGEVSITPSLYNDFYGTLTTISGSDGIEYSVFAGVREGYYEVDKSMISKVASSAGVSLQSENEPEPEVQLSYDTDTDVMTPVAQVEPTPAATESEESEEPPAAEPAKTFEGKTSQKEFAQEAGDATAYVTDIYSMLSVGQTACAAIYADSGISSKVYITLTDILNSERTRELIEEYIATGEPYYNSFTPPAGCHLEAAVFNAKFTDGEGYIDVRLKGMDGESLVYLGHPYPERTYFIKTSGQTAGSDGWHLGYTVFYTVPDGCEEYALSIAGQGEKNYYHPAWFSVQSAN